MIRPGLSLAEMLTDPDEGRFLQALLGQAEDRRALLEYADYLRGRDEARGEFLRLEHLLSGTGDPGGVAPDRQARYRELLALLAPLGGWLLLVRRTDRVLNCGRATTQSLTVRFRFECPNRWETLSPTPEAGVRHCVECRRDVYYCDTAESAERHALAGDCIAVPRRVTTAVGEELTRCVTGMPDVHRLWGDRLFGG